ncbi:MAG: type II secretion system ATPase GspE [Spongiibacteraceae bacterium]|jgi:general secretion pathway protein E|nr:type II secretion system ATPase GspE [Spongiibacteraceae bacterium]
MDSPNIMATMTASRVKPLPFSFARRYGVFVSSGADGEAVVCHRPSVTPQVLAEVGRILRQRFRCEAVPEAEFDRRLAQAYERDSNETMQMVEDLGGEMDLASIANAVPETEDLLEKENDAPIIRLINALLTEAIKQNASDIHLETFERRLVVRYRVDGVLREVVQPKRELAPLLVSRIKVMARLDIAEKRIPQDGRISLRVGGRDVDIRVSTLPSSAGERVVLRLLDKEAGRLRLSSLGMPGRLHEQFRELLLRPHGILLVTGPTGSGKTTTLYAGLTEINDQTRNILTVEDPIEYNIEGIGQTQVNAKADMTFARGLRAILRQDPDVVMVGEIRDRETADIAVQASLTGHLVLSTLHTNTAIGAVTRLRDMGVEPFLLASSLIGVLAQRLVRVLCPHCKRPDVPREMERIVGLASQVWRPAGCAECNQSGFRGRTGIYELIVVNDELRQLIHSGASEEQMLRIARERHRSIRDSGLERVREGITTLEEVLRVTQEE